MYHKEVVKVSKEIQAYRRQDYHHRFHPRTNH
jgi:hypothetical protein